MRIKLGYFHTAKAVAGALGIPTPAEDIFFDHLATDSREVIAGDLFVALRGERYDGHAYIDEARRRGAALLLCEEGYGENALIVQDTQAALLTLAKAARDAIAPTVIAVTGSVGKTTTKDMIAATLGTEYPTHKTNGNQNNALGVALTLLSMPPKTHYLVAELGMNHAREIASLAAVVRPDIAVITNVGQAHIGELGSREAIARAKLEILEGCDSGSMYFYPANEPLLTPPRHTSVKVYPIADRLGADNAFFDVCPEEEYTRFSLDFRRWRYEGLRVRGVGTHVAACAAFAVCIGDLLGVSHEGIAQALLTYGGSGMRQEIFTLKGVTIIEDSYNASPESMRASLLTLSHISKKKQGRSFALLGGMRELGQKSKALHEELGTFCAELSVDYLFPFGEEATDIARGARKGGMHKEKIIENHDASAPTKSAREIASRLCAGDTVLIKASRILGAERVTAELKRILKEEKGDQQ